MLMLLSVHMTSVLFLVWFNNFTLTMGFYWSYTFLLQSPFLCALGKRQQSSPDNRDRQSSVLLSSSITRYQLGHKSLETMLVIYPMQPCLHGIFAPQLGWNTAEKEGATTEQFVLPNFSCSVTFKPGTSFSPASLSLICCKIWDLFQGYFQLPSIHADRFSFLLHWQSEQSICSSAFSTYPAFARLSLPVSLIPSSYRQSVSAVKQDL